MHLSVIILNYNVSYFLELCLSSVFRAVQDIDAEVIVVDNNSADNSCEMVRSKFPEVKLIANAENSGFPKGNNIGFAAASGKYICILNPDTVVAEDTFSKLIDFVQKKDDLGITGVKMVDGAGRFLPESKRGLPTPAIAAGKMLGLSATKYYAEHLPENETGKVEILPGSFMFMERQAYLEAGGFDERYFMYGEDIDLSYSVLKQGFQNYYFPETSIIHFKGESTVKDKAYLDRFSNAMQLFYQKHFNGSALFGWFLKIGAVLFTKKKLSVKPVLINISSYILFSDNETLKSKLEIKLEKKVQRFQAYNENILLSQTISESFHTCVIFDAESMAYAEIIAVMQSHSRKGFIFRIRPEAANFILGSDSSDSRGEVIHFD
ncbi:glycosyltransferase family 2 protein [Flavobacterium sp. J372]|uniref:glycosyltransferase family 2 protein n=1 Tax=Flavobacterium sp. J372 TaxID=2898436 RepID=UPI0021516D66|nr:glycosyltransferase family 2 protein [Flavobacterium sp. J372]MCR5862997.1 glycosyltransferase family 2 protein [Flavobacterium sp. J372]